jgi:hypothetical protein
MRYGPWKCQEGKTKCIYYDSCLCSTCSKRLKDWMNLKGCDRECEAVGGSKRYPLTKCSKCQEWRQAERDRKAKELAEADRLQKFGRR